MDSNDRFEKLYEKQLEFLTELNERTKKESNDISKRAKEVLERVDKTEENVRSHIKKIFYSLITLISIIGTVLAGLGIKNFFDVKIKYDQFVSMTDESKIRYQKIKEITEKSEKYFIQLKDITEEAKLLREIYLEIRRAVDEIKIDKNINDMTLSDLSDASIRFRLTERDLWRYIQESEQIEYLVLFEAINKYLELIDLGGIEFTGNVKATLIEACAIILKKCDEDDWRTQLWCRNFIVEKAQSIRETDSKAFNDLNNLLRVRIASANNKSKYKWNLVIIQFKLGTIDSEDFDYLKDYITTINSPDQHINEPGRTWLSCMSAIELVKKQQVFGWDVFSNYFQQGTFNQKSIAIITLSTLGRKELNTLKIDKHLRLGTKVDIFEFFISNLIQLEKDAIDQYSKAYYNKLTNKLKNL